MIVIYIGAGVSIWTLGFLVGYFVGHYKAAKLCINHYEGPR